MKIVADTNIFLAVALEEPEKEHIIELTVGHDVVCPEILPFEIGNALTAMVKRDRISSTKAVAIYDLTQQIPVQLVSIDIRRALEIALRFNIYAYDAYFLQTALSMGCPLITLDNQMRNVAESLSITVLE
ncbi:MAG: VapC toxin family PIN domain ribonuclease [Anaerolineaceae bacterium]|nr:VapC toxin family PIN domain ribonuclease [Anaerolineaceae bacterium]